MPRGSVGRRIAVWCTAVALAVGVMVPVSQAVTAQPAAAISGSDFDPGYIIADWLFYDGAAMSSSDIQSFLQSKVGACGNANCLRNVTVNPPSYAQAKSSSTGGVICSAITGGSMLVSEWIYRVQAACGISAKVILVTLQKEQGLITSNAPSDAALQAAMGEQCPDTAPCDSAYAGLATQIYTGGKQLKTYRVAKFGRQPGTYWIGFNPNSTPNAAPNAATGECGGTVVTIRDYATAALYNYTPYQPNAAALANPPARGNGCSSYGNRNFWYYYSTWFGDPRGGDPSWVEGAFQDLLGHTSGVAQGTPQNDALINGWTRPAVAASILSADEYRIHVITQTYQRVLGRQPDSGGLNYWLGQTQSGAILPSQIGGQFLVSDELYLRAGNTPQGWVSLMYESVLGRAPDPGGLVAWANTLLSSGRAFVYSSIYNSEESVDRRINFIYQTYLGHNADPGAVAYFAPTIVGGGDEGLAAQIIGSTEYSLRASLRFPDGVATDNPPPLNQAPPAAVTAAVSTSDPPFLAALAADVLGTPASAGTLASWNASLGAGLSHTWLAATLFQSTDYRTKAVSAAYQTVLGRPADAGGLDYWTGQTAPGGTTLPSQVVNALLASDEYMANVGNSTSAWVAGVSQMLLGRAPTADESTTWSTMVGASGRDTTISAIYLSSDSVARRLSALTQKYLHRAATSAETTLYAAALSVYGDEYVAAQMIGSPAYDTLAQSLFPSPFLRSVGTDLLGTDPTAAQIASWSGLLSTGTTHYALASQLYASAAHRTIAITKAYESVLGREPDSAGLSYWLGKTSDGSIRASTMSEQFLLSDELYIRSGNTPQGWVSMLFQTVLGRTPDASGLAYWSSQVTSQGRAAVMWGIYNSPESAIDRLRVMTVQLLGRQITNDDILGLGPLMISGGEEAVGAAIIGSRDYDVHAATRF